MKAYVVYIRWDEEGYDEDVRVFGSREKMEEFIIQRAQNENAGGKGIYDPLDIFDNAERFIERFSHNLLIVGPLEVE